MQQLGHGYDFIDHVNFYCGVHTDIYERMFERRTEGVRSQLTLVATLSPGPELDSVAVATATHDQPVWTSSVDKPIATASGAPV